MIGFQLPDLGIPSGLLAIGGGLLMIGIIAYTAYALWQALRSK
ncbi:MULTISPECIES: hypothetical protein [Cupriavidus]